MGLAQSAYGAGLILGAARRAGRRRATCRRALILIFGAAGVGGGGAVLPRRPPADGFAFAAMGHFLVGFGPMLWLICQMTVRQLVTPRRLMGRVNATLQTAIYGVRPLGALAGGFVAAHAGVHAALLMIAAAFALSALVDRAVAAGPTARLAAAGCTSSAVPAACPAGA